MSTANKDMSYPKFLYVFPVILVVTATIISTILLFFGEYLVFASPIPLNIKWTIVFSAVLLASLEEVVFRFFLLNFLSKKFNFSFAVVVSSLLFGMVHLDRDIGAAINATALGVFLSFIYLEKRKLYQLILIHTLYNLSLAWADGYGIYLKIWHLPALTTKLTDSPSQICILLIGDAVVLFSLWLASLIYIIWYVRLKVTTRLANE